MADRSERGSPGLPLLRRGRMVRRIKRCGRASDPERRPPVRLPDRSRVARGGICCGAPVVRTAARSDRNARALGFLSYPCVAPTGRTGPWGCQALGFHWSISRLARMACSDARCDRGACPWRPWSGGPPVSCTQRGSNHDPVCTVHAPWRGDRDSRPIVARSTMRLIRRCRHALSDADLLNQPRSACVGMSTRRPTRIDGISPKRMDS